ncbi:MAG TPA: fibrobacter succinogenes major paralogous domain-containing protein, partial [Salinivirgaceae bacterium]|nr:fibrobacter succinogenes major paralogous domain-containing protein [Salinivirgaceae bacterium]
SGVQGICPTGWHLPSDAEWKQLEMYLGMTQEQANNTWYRGSNEGGKLKEAGTSHWKSPNEGTTNESGFTALPGGYRSNYGYFYSVGSHGHWWSATEINDTIAWYRSMNYSNSKVIWDNFYKEVGRSVRCLRD